ncbi:SLBB domain-containing protein [candidate division WOR-3 bacterium]|nr:SLBB domain-containing protein [candidate division WOR-3 bacterium]
MDHTHKRIFPTIAGIAIAGLIVPFFINAQNAAEPGETGTWSGLEKPIVSEEYILMPGDSILVTITGPTNYSYITGITFEGKVLIQVPVSSMPTPQGTFMPQYDVVRAVPVYSLTLKDAKDSLRIVFSRYFRNIAVDITLLNMRQFTVFVAGEVVYPGITSARPVDRVSTVIRRAGGVTTLGSRSTIEVLRDGILFQTADLELFERTGNTNVNPFIQDGDVILVSRMEHSVIVKGAVFGKRGYELRVAQLTAARERTSEGLYELLPGERISDLITKAGGTTPWADLVAAYIERDEHQIAINLMEIIADEDNEGNIKMLDGDVLVVPSVNAIVYVQGQVAAPGAYPFQPNLKAMDYIGLAGGPLAEAHLNGAYVIREKERIAVKKDPVIIEGDRIYVPRLIFKFWQDYVAIGAVVASLLISYLTLQTTR